MPFYLQEMKGIQSYLDNDETAYVILVGGQDENSEDIVRWIWVVP